MPYSIRSERPPIEQLDYNLLFRWSVGLTMDDPVWSPTTFSKNRDRLLEGEIARLFFEGVVWLAQGSGLMSDEHFTVDGTLVEARAGQKSFRPNDQPAAPGDDDDPGNPTVNFRGEKRCNAAHASTTDPEARLYRKSNGTEAKLCFAGHVLIENRHGLVADAVLTEAHGRSDHATSRLRGESAASDADRGGLRLAEDGRPDAQDPAPRPAPGRVDVHPRRGRQRHRPLEEPRVGCHLMRRMTAPAPAFQAPRGSLTTGA